MDGVRKNRRKGSVPKRIAPADEPKFRVVKRTWVCRMVGPYDESRWSPVNPVVINQKAWKTASRLGLLTETSLRETACKLNFDRL